MIVRITRASVLEVLDADFVRTAEAKGLTERTVRGRHVLRNALLPVATTIGLLTGGLLSGAVLTEKVFAFGGIGAFIAEAISQRDYPVLMGFILLIAVVYVLVNLLVDLSYSRDRPEGEGAMTHHRARSSDKIDRLAELAARDDERGVSLWQEAFRRLRRNPVAIIGAVILGAVRAGRRPRAVPRPAQPDRADPAAAAASPRPGNIPGPQAEHWLGSDHWAATCSAG